MTIVKTVWAKTVYDVLRDGDDYYVNNSFDDGEFTINCKVKDGGTFKYASPSDGQLKKIFDCTHRDIEVSGDDVHIYVDTDKGYPLGELTCISHESLSPIRKRA
jgi:hypothetical protein